MRSAPMWKAVAGLALATSMWAGTAGAGEQFQTLTEIRAEAMSSAELAAVEGRVTNAKLFNFNPRFFGLQSLLGKGGLNLKGTFTPLGELRLPLLEGGVLNLKGTLHDKLQLTGPLDPQGRLNLHYREAADKGTIEFHLSTLPELLNLDSIIRTRDHALQLNGVFDPKRGLNLLLEDHSTDSGELRLSGLLGLLNLNLKGGIGDGRIQPAALLLHPKTGLHLNSNGSISPSIDLRFTSLSGLLDLHLSGSTNLSGKLQLSNLLDLKRGLDLNLKNGPLTLLAELQLLSFLGPPGGLTLKGVFDDDQGLQLSGLFDSQGRPNLNGTVFDNDSGELQLSGLLGLLNLNLKGFGYDKQQLSGLLDPKKGLMLNRKGSDDESLELALSSLLGPKGGLNLLNFKGTSNETLPLLGLLGPKGLNLNLLGLPLLGRK